MGSKAAMLWVKAHTHCAQCGGYGWCFHVKPPLPLLWLEGEQLPPAAWPWTGYSSFRIDPDAAPGGIRRLDQLNSMRAPARNHSFSLPTSHCKSRDRIVAHIGAPLVRSRLSHPIVGTRFYCAATSTLASQDQRRRGCSTPRHLIRMQKAQI